MKHLFLAPLPSAFGELLHGVRIARALCATGDRVVFAAPARMEQLIEPPLMFGRIDLAIGKLDRELPDLIARMRCDSLVLVDVAAVGKTVRALGLDPKPFTRPAVPVVGLDCWNLPREPVRWDYGAHAEVLAPEFHAIAKRIVPVPFARPDVDGGFCALPQIAPVGRDAVRAELGLAPDDRVILWPSASWQHGANHSDPVLARRADELPTRLLPRLAELGNVVHVGPEQFANAPRRYRFLGQLAPARFEALVAAADLLLCFNAAATSLATAIAAGTPIVLGTSASPPIYAWPLSLANILAPTLANNSLTDAVRRVDVGDELAFSTACRELLEDPSLLRDAQAAYAREVRTLPPGHERLRQLLHDDAAAPSS